MHLFGARPPPPWDIYAEELGGLGLGHPMWHPEPAKPAREIMLGDIGFLRDGQFNLLFNCINTLPKDDQSRTERGESLPNDFVPIELQGGDVRGPDIRLTQTRITCKSFKKHEVHAEAGAGPANMPAEAGVNEESSEDSRASLRFRPPAERTFLACRGTIQQYMAQHSPGWLDCYASRFKIAQNDIIFVYGLTKTTAWEVSVRRNTAGKGSLSLRLLGECLAGIRAGIGCLGKRSYAMGSISYKGPKGRTFGDDKDDNHFQLDQCIFLEYGKTKTRHVVALQTKTRMQNLRRFFGCLCVVPGPQPVLEPERQITSTLPLPAQVSRKRASLEPSGRKSLSYTVGSSEAATKIIHGASHRMGKGRFDPTDALLDYILQDSNAKIAYVSYGDVDPLCKSGRLPTDIVAAAEACSLPIVMENGVSSVSPHVPKTSGSANDSARFEEIFTSSDDNTVERSPLPDPVQTTPEQCPTRPPMWSRRPSRSAESVSSRRKARHYLTGGIVSNLAMTWAGSMR